MHAGSSQSRVASDSIGNRFARSIRVPGTALKSLLGVATEMGVNGVKSVVVFQNTLQLQVWQVTPINDKCNDSGGEVENTCGVIHKRTEIFICWPR